MCLHPHGVVVGNAVITVPVCVCHHTWLRSPCGGVSTCRAEGCAPPDASSTCQLPCMPAACGDWCWQLASTPVRPACVHTIMRRLVLLACSPTCVVYSLRCCYTVTGVAAADLHALLQRGPCKTMPVPSRVEVACLPARDKYGSTQALHCLRHLPVLLCRLAAVEQPNALPASPAAGRRRICCRPPPPPAGRGRPQLQPP